jgi:hypothetical protein
MMMARSPSERVVMAERMRRQAKANVWAALVRENPHASEVELRRLYLRRFYPGELTNEAIEAVARHGGMPRW